MPIADIFTKTINRKSRKSVEGENEVILCGMCKNISKIVARRNSTWLVLFFIEVLEIKKYPPYAACSHCLNSLPAGFSICKKCKNIVVGADTAECKHCTVSADVL
ncbi:hypothetical protein NEMIN01_1875 [Nematocida minor]|uniref:uncharacterized protein n=1 Tax=Nematocida minor TaxID=1912983 RepID=UPI0022205EE9|nr:uncharacterized protein NEMIN01_1875 [Nematocida minor]KAI5192206.1 hypothetical protein NEMIN01_1875 [Nematocida minor]